MKITLKLVLVVLASAALILSLDGYLRMQRNVALFEADLEADAQMLGQVLGSMLADAWQREGQQRVQRIVKDANASHSRLRFNWTGPGSMAAEHKRLSLDAEQIASLREGAPVSVKVRNPKGYSFLYTYVPVAIDSGKYGMLEISQSLATVHDYVRYTILRTIGVWVVQVVLSGCLMLLIGTVVIGRPMRRVIEKTRRVGAGDLDSPLQFRARNEFAEVATALNQMCEQLKASQAATQAEMEARLHTLEQLRHADRLRTVGTLASGIAHELGTPLNVISGRASLITSGRLSPPEVTDSAQIIKEQVQRMTTIIRQLLDFARHTAPKQVAIDLCTLTRQTLDMLMPLATQQQAVLTLRVDDAPVSVRVDMGQMQQVLMNLVTNAWQAMPQGGEIDVTVSPQDAQPPPGLPLEAGRYACVSVRDQGAGICAEDLPHIFDPFFTTKEVGQGTGLGLSIAYGIVRDHGGWIEVHSRPGAGTCFAVYMPMEDGRV
jgi:two-component system, NtrC family, sensor kinase